MIIWYIKWLNMVEYNIWYRICMNISVCVWQWCMDSWLFLCCISILQCIYISILFSSNKSSYIYLYIYIMSSNMSQFFNVYVNQYVKAICQVFLTYTPKNEYIRHIVWDFLTYSACFCVRKWCICRDTLSICLTYTWHIDHEGYWYFDINWFKYISLLLSKYFFK